MFEDLSTLQIWLLIAGAAAFGLYAGRISLGPSAEARAHYRRMAEEQAARDFARLSSTAQAEVDRLAAAGRTIDAVKLIRAALNTGLYEAKQIVDHRKRRSA